MGNTWVESLIDRYHLTQLERFIVYGSLVFFIASAGLVLVLFGSRIKKSRQAVRTKKLREQFQKILNAIVVNETFSEKATPVAAFEYRMAEIRLITGSSSFAKQTLITQILDIKKNLYGSSANTLTAAYYALDLHRHSMLKLRSGQWKKKALAIRELAEFDYRQSIPQIVRWLTSANSTLRQESFMALVRLEEKPLTFLNHYSLELSDWMRINIYNYLSKIDVRKLPDFSQWFNHKNVSVTLFSISMARQFRQTASLPALANLIYSDNPKIVSLAVSTLGEMEAYQYRKQVIDLATHVWHFEKLARDVIQCLGLIGDMNEDIGVVGRFLSHPVYSVRFAAVAALKKLGAGGEEALQAFNEGNDKKIDTILRHFSEPLLR
jgi:hypothetical protein